MKLLIIVTVEDLQEDMSHILHDSGITNMNVVPVTGYRKNARCSALGWFGRGSACAQTHSLLMFSFTSEEIAHQTVSLIDRYNAERAQIIPPRAFVLDISEFSKITPLG